MKEKAKGYLYKNLSAYGFGGAFLLIAIAVLIFNHLWTGLGENPKTQILPQITKDYEEFKDHATLIIALIAAIGSLLSSLIIILFYGAWKDQHNKIEDAKLAKELYLILEQEKNTIRDIRVSVKRLSEKTSPVVTTVNTQLSQEIQDKVVDKMLFIKSNLTIFEDLTNDEEFSLITNLHGESITTFSDYWIGKCKSPTTINATVANENNEITEKHIENITALQKILKSYIKIT